MDKRQPVLLLLLLLTMAGIWSLLLIGQWIELGDGDGDGNGNGSDGAVDGRWSDGRSIFFSGLVRGFFFFNILCSIFLYIYVRIRTRNGCAQ
jgi:hypothetical protein